MKGLTLLEVLISISIIGIIMAVVYGAYMSNVDAIQLTRQEAEVAQKARIVFDRMGKDLASAFLSPGMGEEEGENVLAFIGQDIETDGFATDRLDFTSLSHLPMAGAGPWTDLCEVSYYIEAGPEETGFVLFRRDDSFLDGNPTAGGASFEIADGLKSFEISFQDQRGEIYEDWNSLEGEHKGRLPSLVSIRMTLANGDDGDRLFQISFRPELAGQ
jgi:general secretion pathway protein J